MPTHYETLGIAKTACDAEIKTAYRKLIFANHPDKNRTKPEHIRRECEAKSKELNHAHEILSDPAKRKTYDRDELTRAARASTSTRTSSYQTPRSTPRPRQRPKEEEPWIPNPFSKTPDSNRRPGHSTYRNDEPGAAPNQTTFTFGSSPSWFNHRPRPSTPAFGSGTNPPNAFAFDFGRTTTGPTPSSGPTPGFGYGRAFAFYRDPTPGPSFTFHAFGPGQSGFSTQPQAQAPPSPSPSRAESASATFDHKVEHFPDQTKIQYQDTLGWKISVSLSTKFHVVGVPQFARNDRNSGDSLDVHVMLTRNPQWIDNGNTIEVIAQVDSVPGELHTYFTSQFVEDAHGTTLKISFIPASAAPRFSSNEDVPPDPWVFGYKADYNYAAPEDAKLRVTQLKYKPERSLLGRIRVLDVEDAVMSEFWVVGKAKPQFVPVPADERGARETWQGRTFRRFVAVGYLVADGREDVGVGNSGVDVDMEI
ncbi:hypothetical protein BDV96DRAFT_283714 [Lophiotrema nucula]|uniref:J domain-containing protein n=1 Tax=Lophiotrema nucula TaxID=690887 RepID=A0A6A5YLW4_9PLEO|nr:hypothetical protein BDV96DRAFT_283714 [Lophiotrema nucula]